MTDSLRMEGLPQLGHSADLSENSQGRRRSNSREQDLQRYS